MPDTNSTGNVEPTSQTQQEAPMAHYSEAPVSFNVKAISADGFDIMLTIRDSHPTELMPRALKALDWLKAAGFSPNGRPATAPSASRPQTANGAPAPSPSGPQIAASVPPIGRTNGTNASTGQTSTNGETFGAAIISALVIGQSKSGKIQLQFGDDQNRTYRMTLPLEAMVEMLPGGWDTHHLTVGQAYNVAFRIHWREAGQYKNIFQIDQL